MLQSKSLCGVTLQYNIEGDGYPVILMHGWGCNHTTVQSIERLLSPHFKVYNLDFPGFGGSSTPPSIWGVEEYTQMLEAFVKDENIEAPILIGHSFGGRVSILYASRNKTHKVILVDAAGIKPKRPLKYYLKVYSFKLWKKVLPLVIGKKQAEKTIENYRRKSGSADYNALTGIMRNIIVKVVNEDLKSGFAENPVSRSSSMGKKRHRHPIARCPHHGETDSRCRAGSIRRCRALQLPRQALRI